MRDAGDGEGEIRVVLVSQAQAQGLDSQPEAMRVAVEWLLLGRRLQSAQLLTAQDGLVNLAGAQPLGDDLDGLAQRHGDDDLDRLGEQRAAQDDVRLELLALHRGRLTPCCRDSLRGSCK